MKNKILAFVNALSNGLDELFEKGGASAPSPTSSSASTSTKTSKENGKSSEAIHSWWEKRNAEAFRDQFSYHADRLINTPANCEKTFGNAIDNFFIAHDSVFPCCYFPEIHIQILQVRVYHLHAKWDSRAIPLEHVIRDALAKGLDDALSYRSYRHLIPQGLDYHLLITKVWLVQDVLYFELPISVFSIVYPQFAQVLAPERYWDLLKALDMHTTL